MCFQFIPFPYRSIGLIELHWESRMDVLQWNALPGYIRRSQCGMPCSQLLQCLLQGPCVERTKDTEQESCISSPAVGAQLMEEPKCRLISRQRILNSSARFLEGVSLYGEWRTSKLIKPLLCKLPDRRTIKQSWQRQRDAETDLQGMRQFRCDQRVEPQRGERLFLTQSVRRKAQQLLNE